MQPPFSPSTFTESPKAPNFINFTKYQVMPSSDSNTRLLYAILSQKCLKDVSASIHPSCPTFPSLPSRPAPFSFPLLSLPSPSHNLQTAHPLSNHPLTQPLTHRSTGTKWPHTRSSAKKSPTATQRACATRVSKNKSNRPHPRPENPVSQNHQHHRENPKSTRARARAGVE